MFPLLLSFCDKINVTKSNRSREMKYFIDIRREYKYNSYIEIVIYLQLGGGSLFILLQTHTPK